MIHLKFQFIQKTMDGETCFQQLKLNEEQLWSETNRCAEIMNGEKGIYMTGDESRVLAGQIRNFKFFTYDI